MGQGTDPILSDNWSETSFDKHACFWYSVFFLWTEQNRLDARCTCKKGIFVGYDKNSPAYLVCTQIQMTSDDVVL